MNEEQLINRINQDMKNIESETIINDNPFPIDVFPDIIQDIINETNDKLKYPIDFIASSLLYAVSVATGNTHRIEIIKGYEQSAVVYIMIVSDSGTNKSEPLKFPTGYPLR